MLKRVSIVDSPDDRRRSAGRKRTGSRCSSGGGAGAGTVFKLTATGTPSTLHSFDCSTEGCEPTAGLIQASDGNFYGTTSSGGAAGTVFKATGTLTTLHSFDFSSFSTEGGVPAGLIQASDGNFYGTTVTGGAGGVGTVFKLDGAGTLTTLHSFVFGTEGGSRPLAGLIQASDGNSVRHDRFRRPRSWGSRFPRCRPPERAEPCQGLDRSQEQRRRGPEARSAVRGLRRQYQGRRGSAQQRDRQ